MRKRVMTTAALAAFLLLPAKGFSWNYVGHEVVARIAWDNLTPQARRQVTLLLRQHPARAHDLLKGMPADVGDEDAFAFVVAATWPDIVRTESNPWHAKDHHAAWHFINVPFVLDGTDRTKLKGVEPGPLDWTPGTEPTDAVQASTLR